MIATYPPAQTLGMILAIIAITAWALMAIFHQD